jgi:hypothetical protein
LRKDRPLLERARAVADDLVDTGGPLQNEVAARFEELEIDA